VPISSIKLLHATGLTIKTSYYLIPSGAYQHHQVASCYRIIKKNAPCYLMPSGAFQQQAASNNKGHFF
jgi:hypothetical protein